jgi:hypothetical protein
MTDTLRSKHNELEEVTQRASEELAHAKLIRRSADQDLVQALKSIKDLTAELGATRKENNDLWNTVNHVANLIRVLEDARKSWVQFFPVIPECFNAYVKVGAKVCVQSVLAQIRVLWPTVPLERLTEEIEDEKVLQAVEETEGAMDNLGGDIASQLDLTRGRPVDQPPQPPQ